MSEVDYGTIGEYGATSRAASVKRTQVYQATHVGEQRLSYMNRSFISFTYGGRHIEDFNLIATITGDRIDRAGSAAFNDVVSTYDNLNGQFYWTTHYQANRIDFTLSTDGMEQSTLDDFLYWFRGGVTRELILAEHPNRGIQARIAQPPQLKLLPFENSLNIVIAGEIFPTKTTLFKGEINLSFVMDEPYWYAIKNILGKQNGNEYEAIWEDANGQEISIFRSQDALKILYEDGIPLTNMFDTDMLVGNKMYVSAGIKDISRIWNEETSIGARIESDDAVAPYLLGIIAGSTVTMDAGGIPTLSAGTYGYLYYAGTAPSPTEISFTLRPSFDSNLYIDVPANSFTNPYHPYNSIFIESLHKQELRFTTPNLFTSYNKAIQIFREQLDNTHTWEEVRASIRAEVRHPVVRAFAIEVVEANKSENIAVSSGTVCTQMRTMFGTTAANVTFTFNSKTGKATGKFAYRKHLNDGDLTYNIEEDVGDMLKSNYIYLQDRNYPIDGMITAWTGQNDKTKQQSHRIYHDVSSGISAVEVIFKNMYL